MKKFSLPLLLLTGLIFRLVISFQIYSGDVNNHISWGQDILKYGPGGVYGREFIYSYGTMTPTYPPIPLFIFTASKAMFDSAFAAVWDLNLKVPIFPSNLIYFFEDQDTQPAFFKIWAILADIGIAYLVFKITKRQLYASFVLFNPAFFYNSAYWGQIESIPIFFVVLSLYLLFRSRKQLLSTLALLGALISKQSSIIFLPILAIFYTKRFSPKVIVQSLVCVWIAFWLSFLPFFQSGNILTFPISTYIDKIKTGSGSNFVTDHAFNLWAMLTGLGKIPDILPYWLGIAYHWWGYLFFGAALLIVLVPLIKKSIDENLIYLGLSLITISAFMFLTRMHGRYLLPSLPFLLLYSSHKKWTLIPFFYLSVFYFLNLYHNWWAPRIPILVNFISNVLVINSTILISFTFFCLLLLEYYSYPNSIWKKAKE